MTQIYSVLNPMIGQYKDSDTIEDAIKSMVDIMLEFIPNEHATHLLTENPLSDKPNVMYDYFMIHTHNSPIAFIQLNEDESRTWLNFKINTVKQDVLELLQEKI